MLVKALNLLTLQMVDCCLSWGWAQWGALDSVGGLEESKFIVIFPLIGFVYNLHVSQIAFMALDDTKLNLNWSTRRWATMPGTQMCYLLEVCLLWSINFHLVLFFMGQSLQETSVSCNIIVTRKILSVNLFSCVYDYAIDAKSILSYH